jgi:hypothetical protein
MRWECPERPQARLLLKNTNWKYQELEINGFRFFILNHCVREKIPGRQPVGRNTADRSNAARRHAL